MYVKLVGSSKWLEKNWKLIISLMGTIWTIVVFLSGWLTGVNAAVADVNNKIKPGMKEFRTDIGTVNGKIDVLLTLEGYRVMGRNQEAREYLKTLPSNVAPTNKP